jgi:hypothetical protein
MSATFERGPLRTYQVTYKSGHIEQYQGHQVIIPNLLDLPPIFGVATKKRDMITIHGDFPDGWRLVLAVREDLVESVKDVTGMDLWAQLGVRPDAEDGDPS